MNISVDKYYIIYNMTNKIISLFLGWDIILGINEKIMNDKPLICYLIEGENNVDKKRFVIMRICVLSKNLL